MTSPDPSTAPDTTFRCSVSARERDDPFVATAPPARRWLLVEHPGPWGPQALGGAGYDADTVAGIDAYCRAAGARFQLVRRTRVRGASSPHEGRFAIVDTTPGHESVRWGRVDDPRELPAALADPERTTTPSDDPVYLVCAHGRHDACCAVRGRPVAAVLAAAHPDRTWETTHTGGDRFAANVVLMPHGLVLGRVPATEAIDIVARYDRGEVDTRHVRGRAGLAPPVQAAQHHARLAFDDARLDALLPSGSTDLGEGRWAVDLDGRERGTVRVIVRERWVPASTPLTCSAVRATSMRVYDLEELAPGVGAPASDVA